MKAIQMLPKDYNYLAPDGSEIRLLAQGSHGGLAHCTLPPGKISIGQVHKTVDEIWYFLSGVGHVWLRSGRQERMVKATPSLSLLIPVGTHFQFRNDGSKPLCLVIATMPPWPGKAEAVEVPGKWTHQG